MVKKCEQVVNEIDYYSDCSVLFRIVQFCPGRTILERFLSTSDLMREARVRKLVLRRMGFPGGA